ncbi:MAG: hypothetical protein HFF87_05765 [Oscillibacter sp.]|jgi:predicted permease|nr:hypothetical protein [Oscillibacter sp.]
MRDTFFYTVRAILPILLLILLGSVLRRTGPWSQDFYKQLNQLCFRVFLPVQLFCNVYAIDDLSSMNWRVIAYLSGGVLACTAVGILAARLFVRDPLQKGVVVQAAFRSNQAILGLPLANSLGGAAAMGFAALTTSVTVPLFNILAVVVLVLYSSGQAQRPTPRSVLRQVLHNPLIIGTMLGVFAVVFRQFLPAADGQPIFTIRNQLPSVFDALTRMSGVASPVMLVVLGTRLDLKSAGSLLPQLSLGVVLRLIVSPLLVIGTALLFRGPLGLTVIEFPSVLTIAATPVAVSSAVMVQELGGDDQLAGQIVVWTTILSVATIFCIVYLLRFFGFL